MKESKNNKNYECCQGQCCDCNRNYARGGDAVYGLGIIGAAIFFIGKATTFWAGVIGFLKAIIWPVYFIYEALNFLIK